MAFDGVLYRGRGLLYVATAAESAIVLFYGEVGGVVGVETVATAAADFAVEEAYSFGIQRRVIELASLASNCGVPHTDSVVRHCCPASRPLDRCFILLRDGDGYLVVAGNTRHGLRVDLIDYNVHPGR